MRDDKTIVQIPVNQIDEIPCLNVRRHPVGIPADQKESLLALGRSMLRPTAASPGASRTPHLNFNPTSNATAFSDGPPGQKPIDLSVGQVQPIRVLKYPPEMAVTNKPYGLICGYRRWRAARLVGITALDAQVMSLTYEEYRGDEWNLLLRLMSLTENDQREPLSPIDRMLTLRDLKERYYLIYPGAKKVGRPPSAARTPDAVLPPDKQPLKGYDKPSFTAFAAENTGRSETAIKYDLLLAERLAAASFDLMARNSLTPGAARQLIRLPRGRQTDIINALTRRGLEVTERTIREENARFEHALQKATNGPEASGPELPTALRPLTACNDCPTCHLETDPMACTHFKKASEHLEVAAMLCLDLHYRFSWSEAAIKQVLDHVSTLAEAAKSLEHHLRNPEEYHRFSPASVPFLAAPRKRKALSVSHG